MPQSRHGRWHQTQYCGCAENVSICIIPLPHLLIPVQLDVGKQSCCELFPCWPVAYRSHARSTRSTLIDHCEATCKQGSNHALAYWYCDFRDKNPRPNTRTVLASLLGQLARQTRIYPRNLVDIFENSKKQPVTALPPKLLGGLVSLMISVMGSVYLLVDALDEFCSDEIEELMTLLSALYEAKHPGFRIAVASQPQNLAIASQLEAMSPAVVDVEAVIDTDIRAHIRHTLTVSSHFAGRWGARRQDVLTFIEEKLVQGGDSS